MRTVATRAAGTLELHVRYIGTSPEPAGGTRRQYEYRIRCTEPDIVDEFTGTDLYSGVGKDIDADDMIRTLAGFLDNAAERYTADMAAPDDEYPMWVYEAAYQNADELGMIAIEKELFAQASEPGDAVQTARYISVVFHNPGDDANETLNILDTHGPEAAMEHLTQWDFGSETEYAAEANGHVYHELPSSDLDRSYTSGEYTMTYNHHYGHVHLLRRVDAPRSTGDRPRRSRQTPDLARRDRNEPRSSAWTRPAASEDAAETTRSVPPRAF